MKRAVFEIKQNPAGRYYFIFRDTGGNVLVVSESFIDRSQLEKCLSNVRDKAQIAAIKEGSKDKPEFPLFLIDKRKEGNIFSLIGFDGEVIFSSEVYQQKNDCIQAIELLKSLSFDAGIVDSV